TVSHRTDVELDAVPHYWTVGHRDHRPDPGLAVNGSAAGVPTHELDGRSVDDTDRPASAPTGALTPGTRCPRGPRSGPWARPRSTRSRFLLTLECSCQGTLVTMTPGS